MGDQAVGDIVFSEPYEASADGQTGKLRIPVKAQFPLRAEHTALQTVDQILPFLLNQDRAKRALVLALGWYEKGIRMSTPLDRLLSYLIGIETIVNAYASTHGPIPQQTERENRFEPVLMQMSEELDKSSLDLLKQRLVEPTLAERFTFYVQRHGWNIALGQKFRRLRQLRNDAIHGNAVSIDPGDARRAEDILFRLLKAELGLIGPMPRDNTPRVSSVVEHYQLILNHGNGTGQGKDPGG